MRLEDLVPKTKFVDEYNTKYGKSIAKLRQLQVVYSELLEIHDAISKHDDEHTSEEVVDAIHSLCQILYMIPSAPERFDRILQDVIKKNQDRGYYDQTKSAEKQR